MLFEILVLVVLFTVAAILDDFRVLLVLCVFNFLCFFLWTASLIEFPTYPTIRHGALYWTYSDLCEALHLLFWLCLRWIALMFWYCTPTSPIVLTLDPPPEY